MSEGNFKIKHHPEKISKVKLSDSLSSLVQQAKDLYQQHLAYFAQNHNPPAYIATAPGRVNLIGEHTDYTGGFVLPMALDRATVAYGTGYCHSGKGKVPTSVRLRIVSAQGNAATANGDPMVYERKIKADYVSPPAEDDPRSWTDYVMGTVAQYMPDLPKEGCVVDLVVAYASDIPLGAGLSSSAALEVATAMMCECVWQSWSYAAASPEDGSIEVVRALRCQKAENEWAYSPCGIMDQMVSSAATAGHFLLIDCRNLALVQVPMKPGKPDDEEYPVILICDSKITHSIAGEDGEYAKRRRQCHDALEAMQQVPLYHVLTLRDANTQDVKEAYTKLTETADSDEDKAEVDVIFKRARHVVRENKRVTEAKVALRLGSWDRVGELMHASHESLKNDFEVSCAELDALVEWSMAYDGVYGSRMTGGGFGGCTVTLVKKSAVEGLQEHLVAEFSKKFPENKPCDCFVVEAPAAGARVLGTDMDCKPESDFYKDLHKTEEE